MKKVFLLITVFVTLITLSSCSTQGNTVRQQGKGGVNDILASASAAAEESSGRSTENESMQKTAESVPATAYTESEEQQTSETTRNESGVDVDLTVLSGTVVYSEVYNMMVSPENYLGKTVRMKGAFAVYLDESTGKYYFACIIQDATACCSQGIEFELEGDHTYPDDYPPVGEDICVTGVFDTYREGDYMYCTLRNAVFEQDD